MSTVSTFSTTVVSAGPIVLPASPERGEGIQVRVTVPMTGTNLPVIVFSHGFGQSMSGYAPLVEDWAALGIDSQDWEEAQSATSPAGSLSTKAQGS